jgi:hypothetical protein
VSGESSIQHSAFSPPRVEQVPEWPNAVVGQFGLQCFACFANPLAAFAVNRFLTAKIAKNRR